MEPKSVLALGTIRKYHRLGGLNIDLSSCGSEVYKAEVKDLAGLVSDEDSLPDLQIIAIFLFAHMTLPWCMHVCRKRASQ